MPVQRYQPKRLAQRRLNNRNNTSGNRGTFLRSQTPRAIEKKQRQDLARDFDTFFKESTFGNIKDIETEYSQIDPNIRQYMSYNPLQTKTELNNRISEVKSAIDKSNEKERKYKQKDNYVSKKGEQGRQRGLEEGLRRLEKGDLLSLNDIYDYASEMRSYYRKKARNKEAKKPTTKSSAKTKYVVKTKSGKSYPTNNPNFKPKGETVSGVTNTSTGKTKYSSSSEPEIQIGIKDAKTGEAIQKASINYPKKTVIKSPSSLVSNKGLTANITQVNSITGIKERVRVDLSNNKVISRETSQLNKTQLNNVLSLANKDKLQQLTNGIGAGLLVVPQGQKVTQTIIPVIRGLNLPNVDATISNYGSTGAIVETNLLQRLDAKNKKQLQNLNILRLNASKGNNNARAALIGLQSVPNAFLDVASDTAVGLFQIISNPSQVINSLVNTNWKQAGANFGKRIKSGDPKALLEFLTSGAGLKGVKVPSKFVDIKPIRTLPSKFKGLVNNYKQNLRLEKAVLDEKIRKAKLNNDIEAQKEFKKIVDTVTQEIKQLDNNKLPLVQNSAELARFSNNLQKKNKAQVKKLFEQQTKINENYQKAPKQSFTYKQIKPEINSGYLDAIYDRIRAREKFENFLTNLYSTSGTQYKALKKKINSAGYKLDVYYLKESDPRLILNSGKASKLQIKLVPKQAKPRQTKVKKQFVLSGDGKRKIRIDKKKGAKVVKEVEVKELTKQEQKRLDKQLNANDIQDLKDLSKTVSKKSVTNTLRSNKKARTSVLRTLRTNTQKLQKGSRVLVKQINKGISKARNVQIKYNKINQANFKKGNKFKDYSKTQKQQLKSFNSKGKTKLKQRLELIKSTKSEMVKLKGILPFMAKDLGKDIKSLTKQEKVVSQALDKLTQFDSSLLSKADFTAKSKGKGTGKGKAKTKATKPTLKKPVKKLKKSKPVKPKVKKVRTPKAKKKVKRVRVPSLDIKDFNSKSIDNKIAVFEAIYRERKDPNKKTSKTNKVVTKSLKIRNTRNRALKKVADLADKKLIRSINVKLIGVTKKVKKDIVKPSVLKKFTQKKSVGTPVLRLVEKSKFALDKKSEKRELKKSKR